MHATEARYIKRDVITILRTCLERKPLNFIKWTCSDYEALWEYLDSIYEDPRFVSDTITQAIVKFRPIRDGEDARFCDLVHLVRRCYNTLKERSWFAKRYGQQPHAFHYRAKDVLWYDRKAWSRDLENNKQPVTLLALMTWMTTEIKSRMRATAPLRTGSHYTSINLIEVGNNHDKWSIGTKCWICKTQEYWTDECQTFLALRLKDCKRIAHESHACFSCLQRVGKDHNLNTCRRRNHALWHRMSYRASGAIIFWFTRRRRTTLEQESLLWWKSQKLYCQWSPQICVVEVVYTSTQTLFWIQERKSVWYTRKQLKC